MTHDAVVIGAGVSGLAAAYDLARRGRDVLVLERQVATGGNAVSERIGGFLMEHGPSTMNASAHAALDFTAELDLAGDAVDLGPNVRKRYLLDEDGLTGVSAHPLGFFLSSYLSLPARLSMMGEILRPRRQPGTEETVYAFTRRRFGDEFARKVMEPLSAGLFMGDSKALSVEAVFPKLVEFERELGSITRAILRAKRGGQPGRRLFSWPGGIGVLPQKLASILAGRIHTGATVTGIIRGHSGLEIATANSGNVHTRAVVLAVQPHVAAAMLADIDAEAAEAAGAIAAPPIGVVFLGYEASQVTHPLDGLGFLSTRSSGGVVSGAQFCSTMFPNRAPDGHVSISCYIGGARNPDLARLSADNLIALAHEEMSALLGIRGTPVLSRTRHWARGLPQYDLGHIERRKALEATPERMPGLFLTGNYLQGVSVANCLNAARETAHKTDLFLAKAQGRQHRAIEG